VCDTCAHRNRLNPVTIGSRCTSWRLMKQICPMQGSIQTTRRFQLTITHKTAYEPPTSFPECVKSALIAAYDTATSSQAEITERRTAPIANITPQFNFKLERRSRSPLTNRKPSCLCRHEPEYRITGKAGTIHSCAICFNRADGIAADGTVIRG